MATSVLGQPDIEGVHGKVTLYGRKVCVLVAGKYRFVWLPSCNCVPYELSGGHRTKGQRKNERILAKIQVDCSRRHEEPKEHGYSLFTGTNLFQKIDYFRTSFSPRSLTFDISLVTPVRLRLFDRT